MGVEEVGDAAFVLEGDECGLCGTCCPCGFVSVHLVLSDRTRGMLGAPELRAMRPHAYLLNPLARVDRTAYLRALREGWIAGAGLDVFDTEPLTADDSLLSLPNVLDTPHLGYVTERNYRTFYTEAVDDITAFLADAPVRPLTHGRSASGAVWSSACR